MSVELKGTLKQIALTNGEKAAKLGVDTAIKLIEAIVKDTENTIDNAAFEFVQVTLLPKLYEVIDKIDGVEGNIGENN